MTAHPLQLQEYEDRGRKDAEQGVFNSPYIPAEDPTEEDCNDAYLKGFRQRRIELGVNFQWR
jgi:hypothetical protein